MRRHPAPLRWPGQNTEANNGWHRIFPGRKQLPSSHSYRSMGRMAHGQKIVEIPFHLQRKAEVEMGRSCNEITAFKTWTHLFKDLLWLHTVSGFARDHIAHEFWCLLDSECLLSPWKHTQGRKEKQRGLPQLLVQLQTLASHFTPYVSHPKQNSGVRKYM